MKKILNFQSDYRAICFISRAWPWKVTFISFFIFNDNILFIKKVAHPLCITHFFCFPNFL